MGKHGYFQHLNYTMGDEDSGLERQILPEGARHVVAIAGAGGRVLPLLAKAPRRLSCIDINAPQLHLTALRLATLQALSHADFLGFWGYPPEARGWSPARRREVLHSLDLAPAAALFLYHFFDSFGYDPPIYQGRFEKTLATLSKINRFIAGKRGRAIFRATPPAARAYFQAHFPHRRFRLVLFLLGNSAILNSLLYKGDFPRKNIPGSTFSIYQAIFVRLLADLPPRESFFLQMAFLGELHYPEGNPDECTPAVFHAAQQALGSTEIRLHETDYRPFFQDEVREVDFVSFSDVPSFLPDAAAQRFLQEMSPALVPGALVVTRAHLRVAHPNTAGFGVVSAQYRHLMDRERTQLWRIQIYRKAV
jgi:S-adenosylmethionine-diacylglycerol 3-amino-3-carboxypropyl transferase